jgi:hypothetical protein
MDQPLLGHTSAMIRLVSRTWLAPAVLRYIEHNSVVVFEFLFSIDARIIGQFHEKFAAVILDLIFGCAFIFTTNPKSIQPSPARLLPP